MICVGLSAVLIRDEEDELSVLTVRRILDGFF